MKTRLILIGTFLCSSLVSLGQTTEDRISSVENNLHLQTIADTEVSKIGKSIYHQLEAYKIPGASVAIIANGKIDWIKSYGTLQVNGLEKVTENTVFQCASIGKVVTAIAALQLVEKELMELDEAVNSKLTKWKIAENEKTLQTPVTLRHLLSHSSGLTDGYGFRGYKTRDQLPTLLQILNNESPSQDKKSLDIKTLPGTKERYSGAGYLIIQLLIEELTQQSFEQYIAKNIFEPLEMKNSTYSYTPDKSLGLEVAHGHIKGGTPIKGRKYNFYPEKGAAGPWTTAKDLGILIIEMQKAYHGESNSLLRQATIKEMFTPQINHKGLGINLKGFNGADAFWHAGQNLGYMGLMYGTLASRSGAVILMNADYGERFMQEFITSVSTAYHWPVMKSHQTLPLSEEDKKQMVGSYLAEKGGKRLYLKEKKGVVFVSGSKNGKGYQLFKTGTNHYSFKGAQDYYKISFEEGFKTIRYAESPGKYLDLIKE